MRESRVVLIVRLVDINKFIQGSLSIIDHSNQALWFVSLHPPMVSIYTSTLGISSDLEFDLAIMHQGDKMKVLPMTCADLPYMILGSRNTQIWSNHSLAGNKIVSGVKDFLFGTTLSEDYFVSLIHIYCFFFLNVKYYRHDRLNKKNLVIFVWSHSFSFNY